MNEPVPETWTSGGLVPSLGRERDQRAVAGGPRILRRSVHHRSPRPVARQGVPPTPGNDTARSPCGGSRSPATRTRRGTRKRRFSSRSPVSDTGSPAPAPPTPGATLHSCRLKVPSRCPDARHDHGRSRRPTPPRRRARPMLVSCSASAPGARAARRWHRGTAFSVPATGAPRTPPRASRETRRRSPRATRRASTSPLLLPTPSSAISTT